MTRTIPYAFDTIMEADERLQDAAFYYHLDKFLEARGDVVLAEYNALEAPSGAWGRDWHGMMAGRREMGAQPYEDACVRRMLSVVADFDDVNDLEEAVSNLTGGPKDMILRNLRNPVSWRRHCTLGDSLQAHLSAIMYRPGDRILLQRDHGLEYLRRFLIVDGQIAAESPMAFDPDLARAGGAFPALQVDTQGELISSPEAWRDMQAAEAEFLLSSHALECGAVDVGLIMRDGAPAFARVESITSAPPGGVFPYMADLEGYARAVADRLAQPAPAVEEEPAP